MSSKHALEAATEIAMGSGRFTDNGEDTWTAIIDRAIAAALEEVEDQLGEATANWHDALAANRVLANGLQGEAYLQEKLNVAREALEKVQGYARGNYPRDMVADIETVASSALTALEAK